MTSETAHGSVYPAMKLIVAAFVLLAFLGCARAPGYQYSIHISPTVSAEGVGTVYEARQLWLDAVPELSLDAVIGDCERGDVEQTACVKLSQDPTPAWHGLTTRDAPRDSSDVWLRPSCQTWTRVIAHELGHAMGLEHATHTGPLMYHTYEGESQDGPTAEDVEAWRALRQ